MKEVSEKHFSLQKMHPAVRGFTATLQNLGGLRHPARVLQTAAGTWLVGAGDIHSFPLWSAVEAASPCSDTWRSGAARQGRPPLSPPWPSHSAAHSGSCQQLEGTCPSRITGLLGPATPLMTFENCLHALEGAELMKSAQTWPGCDQVQGETCPSPCRAAWGLNVTPPLSGRLREGCFCLHGFIPMILISLLCEVVWGCSSYERHSKIEHSRALNSRRKCPHVADVSHIAEPFVWKDSATYAQLCCEEGQGVAQEMNRH